VRTTDTLYAIDGSTGDLIWSYLLPKGWSVAPPIIQNDIVVVTHNNGVTAFNFITGELLWEELGSSRGSLAFPASSNDKFVVIIDNDVIIRDVETGKLLWKIENPYSRSNALVGLNTDAGYLYVAFRDQIRSYDLKTKSQLWNNLTEGWLLKSGLFDRSILYLERKEGGVSAYNLETQEILWRRTDLSLADYPLTQYKGVLFIGTQGSAPVALNALTGEILWISEGVWDYDNYQTPLIIDQTVYIRGLFSKRIYALNKNNGKLIGYVSLGLPDIFSSNSDYSLGPVQSGKLIIFPADNKLLAYGK
jgi:outer membrane protein assembly factor BamB